MAIFSTISTYHTIGALITSTIKITLYFSITPATTTAIGTDDPAPANQRTGTLAISTASTADRLTAHAITANQRTGTMSISTATGAGHPVTA